MYLHNNSRVEEFMLAGYSEEQAIKLVERCIEVSNKYSVLGVTYEDVKLIMKNTMRNSINNHIEDLRMMNQFYDGFNRFNKGE